MKKILLILMAVFMSVVLIACNAGDNIKSDDDNGSNAASDISDKGDKNESKSEEITLEALMKVKESPASDFEYIEVDGGVSITQYIGDDAMVVIPEKIKGKPVVAVGEKAFFLREDVQAVKIMDSVKEIQMTAFMQCVNLKYFVSGKNLKTIGEHAFAYCASLEEVVLNDGLERLEKNCFLAAPLSEVDIPDSVTYLEIPFSMRSNKDRTIISGKGTAAEQYAIDNGCIFKER